jgi:hypothetical protein
MFNRQTNQSTHQTHDAYCTSHDQAAINKFNYARDTTLHRINSTNRG